MKNEYLEWWLSLSFEEQFYKIIEFLSYHKRDTTELHPHEIKNEEIKQIYSFNKNNNNE